MFLQTNWISRMLHCGRLEGSSSAFSPCPWCSSTYEAFEISASCCSVNISQLFYRPILPHASKSCCHHFFHLWTCWPTVFCSYRFNCWYTSCSNTRWRFYFLNQVLLPVTISIGIQAQWQYFWQFLAWQYFLLTLLLEHISATCSRTGLFLLLLSPSNTFVLPISLISIKILLPLCQQNLRYGHLTKVVDVLTGNSWWLLKLHC